MEHFSLASLILRRWLIIVVVTLLVTGAGYYVSSHRAPVYSGSMSITEQANRHYPTTQQLILQPSQSVDLQSVIATTQSWLVDPYYVGKALAGAQVDTSMYSFKDYTKVFKIVSSSGLSSSYQIQYSGASENEVRAALASLKTVLEDASTSFNQKDGEIDMVLDYSSISVTSHEDSQPILPFVALAIGLVFALLIAALVDRPRA